MNTDTITPMILTYNEEANIGRCLEKLRWAKRILVVDSFSTDRTLELCSGFPQVEVVQRAFDRFGGQANFGLERVESEWVMSLDADYILGDGLIDEIRSEADGSFCGYSIRFVYAVFGRPLRGTLYPPRICLYRKAGARYIDDGHAHRVCVEGSVRSLRGFITHDDRKSISRWMESQSRYAREECEKLLASEAESLGWPDRVRRLRVVAPFATLAWCLIFKRLALDGRAGWFYTFQRVAAEWMLSIDLLEHDLRISAREDVK